MKKTYIVLAAACVFSAPFLARAMDFDNSPLEENAQNFERSGTPLKAAETYATLLASTQEEDKRKIFLKKTLKNYKKAGETVEVGASILNMLSQYLKASETLPVFRAPEKLQLALKALEILKPLKDFKGISSAYTTVIYATPKGAEREKRADEAVAFFNENDTDQKGLNILHAYDTLAYVTESMTKKLDIYGFLKERYKTLSRISTGEEQQRYMRLAAEYFEEFQRCEEMVSYMR